MKLQLTSIGGFAGPAAPQIYRLPADATPAVLQQVSRLLAEADFFNLPTSILKAAPRSSDFLLELRVEEGARQHVVKCHADAVSPAMRELLELMQGYAVHA